MRPITTVHACTMTLVHVIEYGTKTLLEYVPIYKNYIITCTYMYVQSQYLSSAVRSQLAALERYSPVVTLFE